MTVFVIDFDEIGSDEAKSVIENARYPNHCISPEVVELEEAEIGEWHDDHPLNKVGCDWSTYFNKHDK